MTTIGFPPFTVAVFVAMAGGALFFDIRQHRDSHTITLREAGLWSLGYVGLAGIFALLLAADHGVGAASLFLAGYVMEKVLSVDNLVVFGAVFAACGVNGGDRHRALHYGVFGAVAFRLIFVFVGVGSLWLFGRAAEFAFAAAVGYSAWQMRKGGAEEEDDLESRGYMRWLRKHFGESARFWLCVCALEVTDVLFAFDSVPAVIAIVQDPLIVYTAMIFAILGLRSLFFVLDALREKLRDLETGVFRVLVFIAAKLFLHAAFGVEVPPLASLAIVLGLLGWSVHTSLRAAKAVAPHGA